jgi:hypothetical protein
LAIKVFFGEDTLDDKLNRVIGANMFHNNVGDVCRDVGEGTVIGR